MKVYWNSEYFVDFVDFNKYSNLKKTHEMNTIADYHKSSEVMV